jgi:hypothetical protein
MQAGIIAILIRSSRLQSSLQTNMVCLLTGSLSIPVVCLRVGHFQIEPLGQLSAKPLNMKQANPRDRSESFPTSYSHTTFERTLSFLCTCIRLLGISISVQPLITPPLTSAFITTDLRPELCRPSHFRNTRRCCLDCSPDKGWWLRLWGRWEYGGYFAEFRWIWRMPSAYLWNSLQ